MDQPFDIVIVGAGSAGCVLANRLSRDPSLRILLLEAGGWDRHPLVSVPVGCRKITQYGLYDWGDMSEPEPNLNGRRLPIPHGKVVGGGSSVNYMAHTRGHPLDYDCWAAAGAEGWSYRDVLPYFKACESWEGGEDAWRGGSGELGAEMGRLVDPIFKAWYAAVEGEGYELSPDINGEKPEGFGTVQYTVKDGRRSSSARAFLKPAMSRKNLTVRTNSTVTKVLMEGRRAAGVEYVAKGGRTVRVRASRRVVLCLGAINTPHLLMLSGIGPAAHLKSKGIAPIADLPVGQHLEDHLGYSVYWTRKTPGVFHRSLRLDRIGSSFALAYLSGRGPASRLPGTIFGFLRSKADLRQPDLQFILQMMPTDADFWLPVVRPPYQDGFGIRVQLIGQKSRGEVLLRSGDPMERPAVVYNSLSEPEDLAAMREGFRRAWRIGGAPAMSEFRRGPLSPPRDLQDDSEIDAFIREQAVQLYHPACTCRMGREGDAVLNPDLTVRGLEGLSVADASVMPHLVSANANVPTIMIGAKAADLIARG